MHNTIIAIPDDDCEIIPNPSLTNNNNTLANTSDDEYIIVTPHDASVTAPNPTSKPIKVTGNTPDYEALRPLF